MGRRARFSTPHKPHNIPITVLGAALLWFGWFGFNGGAASTIEQAGLIWVNTLVAPAAGMITWITIERLRASRPSSIGSVSGLIAGLVAITPACADVEPYAAILIGIAAGAEPTSRSSRRTACATTTPSTSSPSTSSPASSAP